jgi:hypothetical protein
MLTSNLQWPVSLRLLAVAGLMAAGASLGGRAAPAQTDAPMTPDQLRACICTEQAITQLREELQSRSSVYNQRTDRDRNLTQQIDKLRATMNPDDMSAQDQMREMIDMRGRLRAQIHDDFPALQLVSNKLNAQVSAYNANCVNRPIYRSDEAVASQNLTCLKP